jgi:hypothetical protein
MPKRRDWDEDADREGLNEHQQRRVLVTCKHVDKLLHNVGDILAASSSPFGRYQASLTSAQQETLETSIGSIREGLVWALDRLGVEKPAPDSDAVFAARTTVSYAEMAIDDLRPESMTGYGDVPVPAATVLNAVVDELSGLLQRLAQFLESVSASEQTQVGDHRRTGDIT